MAILTVQKIVLTGSGLTPTVQAAAAGGDSAPNDGRTYIEVRNAHATLSRTVTFNSLKLCDQGSDHDVVATVPALTTKRLGPFRTDEFNDGNGRVGWTYSSEADLTVGAFQLPEKGR